MGPAWLQHHHCQPNCCLQFLELLVHAIHSKLEELKTVNAMIADQTDSHSNVSTECNPPFSSESVSIAVWDVDG